MSDSFIVFLRFLDCIVDACWAACEALETKLTTQTHLSKLLYFPGGPEVDIKADDGVEDGDGDDLQVGTEAVGTLGRRVVLRIVA